MPGRGEPAPRFSDVFGIQDQAPLVLSVVVALAAPAALAWRYAVKGHRSKNPVNLGLALALLGQLGAIFAVFLYTNDTYQFYSSWADLAGIRTAPAAISVNGLSPGEGQIEVMNVNGTASHVNADVMVWLPPQYNEPHYKNHKFPVMVFYPGQPSTPSAAFHTFHFGQVASQMIKSGKIKPFIAAFPTLMIAPPRDTECTNVPAGGPQALSWLQQDVPNAIRAHYRVQPMGKQWSLMGWSTGGFCAAKVLLKQPTSYSAAVSFGGYYDPIQDSTTGNLFHGLKHFKQSNSPSFLYQKKGLGSDHLLVVASRSDPETWPSTQKFLALSAGDGSVSTILPASGGHNTNDYSSYLPQALAWLGQQGALG